MGNSQDKPFMPGCCEEESRGKLRVFVDKNRSTGAAESPTDVRNSFVGRHSAYGGGSSPTRNSPQRVGGNVFTSSVGSSPWTARTPRDAAPAEETSMCDCGTPRNSREEKERKKAFVVQRQQRQEAELLSPGSHSDTRAWSLDIDLVAARNVPDNLPDFANSQLMCCISVLRTDQPPALFGTPRVLGDIPKLAAYHELAPITEMETLEMSSPHRSTAGARFALDRPQFRSKRKDCSSVVLFAERYHSVECYRGLELDNGVWVRRRSDEPKLLTGNQVTIFISLHLIERDGQATMVGTATLNLSPCLSIDKTVYLESATGTQLTAGSAPCALAFKVAYSDSAAGVNTLESPYSRRPEGNTATLAL